MTGAREMKSIKQALRTFAALIQGYFRRPIRTEMDDDLHVFFTHEAPAPTAVEIYDGLPTLFKEDVPAPTADDVVWIIHLHNDTDRRYLATVRADFATTVDDESGAALHHGSAGTEVELAPGESARIGDILGWELDSHLGLDIEFRHAGSDGSHQVSYDLKIHKAARPVAGLGELCEVSPFTLRVLG